jgi:hypothetical protein
MLLKFQIRGVEMAPKPKPKQVCPIPLQEEHTKLLGVISETLQTIKTDVESLKRITIKNGNADGTPTSFEKDDYYQMVYNTMHKLPKEIKAVDDKIGVVEISLAAHLGNTFKNNLGKFNWWINALIPVALLVLVLLYYSGVKDVEKIATELLKLKSGAK